jgi:sensor histidine kinase regulating citrate/malate metabolism
VQGDTLKPGMGMTVIAAWVESLGGQWALESQATGMRLTARFPCT